MALPILDGNQSATTLSTILSSGQHITAHTVVSLGTQAITDIVNATSAGLTNTQLRASAVTVGGTVTVGNSLTISSLPAISGTVTANLGANSQQELENIVQESQYISGKLNSVTIGSLPAISGTVTANLANVVTTDLYSVSSAVKVTGADGQGVLLGGLNISGNPENVYEGGAIPVRGSVGMDVPISGTVTVGNSVTIGSLPAISGTVTAGNIPVFLEGLGDEPCVRVGGVGADGAVLSEISNQVRIISSDSNSIIPISGTVTANTFAVQGTAVTTSNFTSTTASTVLASFNATREVLTIFNEGAGNLHICAGATCTTIAYQVRLSAGDYYEVPNHQTTITHSAVFATAGTARVTEVS
jgi:hypothetical protein